MWSIAAQHKKYNDALSAYNSLRDPHLNSYFRKPQIRKHLLRAHIINKDNKIVDEISSTKHLQNVERKHKRELYHLLEEMVKGSDQSGDEQLKPGPENTLHKAWSIKTQEELIQQAKIMFSDANKEHLPPFKSNPSSMSNERSTILQRLDRMIRTIAESEHLNSSQHESDANNKVKMKSRGIKISSDSNLRTSKSYQDISDSRDISQQSQLKSYSSSSHLSRESRPKSSYGRQRSLATSDGDLTQSNKIELDETMTTSKSVANIAHSRDVQADSVLNGEDIESLGGDSWDDSDHENRSRDAHQLSSRFQTKSSKIAKKWGRDKFANSSSRQRVRMTLKYNGLNGATNRGVKRNVKVLQQVTMGGNSILIHDSQIVPGDMFTFDIRPHPTNSFSIIIVVNGIRDLRLNTCCEHKHRPGTKLSHFEFVDVVGGRPCFACQHISSDRDKIDVNKLLSWFSIQTEENEANQVESSVPTDEEIREEVVLNENKETNSVNITEKANLDLQRPELTLNSTAEETALFQLTEQEEIHGVDVDLKDFEQQTTQQTKDNEQSLSDHPETKLTSQSESENQNLELENIPSGESNSERLASIADDIDIDIRLIDYIHEETLPSLSNMDSDSDNSIIS